MSRTVVVTLDDGGSLKISSTIQRHLTRFAFSYERGRQSAAVEGRPQCHIATVECKHALTFGFAWWATDATTSAARKTFGCAAIHISCSMPPPPQQQTFNRTHVASSTRIAFTTRRPPSSKLACWVNSVYSWETWTECSKPAFTTPTRDAISCNLVAMDPPHCKESASFPYDVIHAFKLPELHSSS